MFVSFEFKSLFYRLAERHGLEYVDRQTFHDYCNKHKGFPESQRLMQKMKALQVRTISKDKTLD